MTTLDGIPLFKGKVQLLRWLDSSSAGKTVTFALDIDSAPDSHPFKGLGTGKYGQEFMLVAVPITSGGTPIPPGATTEAAIGSAAADHPPPPERSAAPGGAKERKSWYEQPASQRAGILCNDPEFWRWTGSQEAVPYVEISRHPRSADEAASWFRTEMDIASRAHLDPSHSCFDPMALNRFQKMERAYRTSRGWETEEVGR